MYTHTCLLRAVTYMSITWRRSYKLGHMLSSRYKQILKETSWILYLLTRKDTMKQ